MNSNLKSFLYALSAVLLWSTAATAFKLTLNGMNYTQLLFYSSLVSTIALFLIIYFKNPKEIRSCFQLKSIKSNLLLGLMNPFLYYLVLFKAYSLIQAQEAMPLNYTWPITITIFSSIFLKQKLSSKTVIGVLIAFLGVFVIATRGELLSFEFQNILGISLALGSSILWASFWTMNLLDKRPESVKLFGAFLSGTVLIFVYVVLFDSFILHDYNYLFGSTYIGLFEMGITFFLWMTGLQLSNNKAKTSTLAFISPFLSMIFIALILGESILISSLFGLLLIVSGIMIQHIYYENGKIRISLE